MIDPSELLRPEIKHVDKSKFRDYTVDDTDPLKERVRRTYRQMHLNQTVGFVKGLPSYCIFCGSFRVGFRD